MTSKELSQLYHLNREIERLTVKLRDMENDIGSVPSPNLSGLPRGNEIKSKTEYEALKIAELKELIETRKKEAIEEQLRLEGYINNIPDSLTRQIFHDRFVNGLPWGQVAANIGGKNTTDSVKKVCYRYIQKSRKK